MLKFLTASQVKFHQASEHLTRRGEDTGDAVQTAAIVAGGVVVAGLVVAGITAFVQGRMAGLGG